MRSQRLLVSPCSTATGHCVSIREPGRTIDGRANLEFALRRSRIVARKHGVDRAKDQGL